MEMGPGCHICKDESIPDLYVADYYVNGGYIKACPECVLKDRGETSFQGEQAQLLLEQFRKWKKRRKK